MQTILVFNYNISFKNTVFKLHFHLRHINCLLKLPFLLPVEYCTEEKGGHLNAIDLLSYFPVTN